MRIETTRNDSIQIERTRFGEAKYSVKWTSNCKYELELLSTTMSFLKDKIGRKYLVTITEVLENKCNIECLILGKNFVHKDTMIKIK